jgi:GTP cyclohydrolase II
MRTYQRKTPASTRSPIRCWASTTTSVTGVAVRSCKFLGTRVRVLTNNPAKLEGLAAAGIEVSGRVPLHGPINADNRRYLTAKATRAGHKLDHLLGALADATDASPEPVGGGQAP